MHTDPPVPSTRAADAAALAYQIRSLLGEVGHFVARYPCAVDPDITEMTDGLTSAVAGAERAAALPDRRIPFSLTTDE